ncbi:MAG: bifunctional diaminohydroxyphosphoribosylaminopyrimidine deaminase/5-amino-6-(5-phosphoribosylamino)uracil reductase RibD [Planctomycetaceae bacterium]|nr:bifunctional diaminohydroxyphosphoribosylaminopyrimidine deaminase/5-amino-6-(5-phosphoribosylamino)uracil reductase RibD [Planctomycetaceae bacterium]MBQ2822868.1 bifunctional diaminohydroxyphosphoribosylaminopyrimidine deaminase/5-amino-6-(5-phosphoribosylamino)uracil reductase RibD [Thermoguttaceae bacterium]
MNEFDEKWMFRALKLAAQGRGDVEPNPMVGCVLVSPDGQFLGEGWHQKYGQPHAEINALLDAEKRGNSVAGATAYVTLEPCCHYGKTPPCAKALCDAKIARVVCAMRDPFPKVAGGGFRFLEEAGILTEVGLLEKEARILNAPYLKLVTAQRPWVIGKWAMTLDGKIATRTGSSRWISSEESRNFVHETRARVDAILVGVGTVLTDDPMLNARPNSGMICRQALRIVADARLEVPLESKLVQTAHEIPVLLAIGADVPEEKTIAYRKSGCEIFRFSQDSTSLSSRSMQMAELLDELGRRRLTNLLVEGGSSVLGALLDIQAVDEVNVFIAPKLCGGREAFTPISGMGLERMENAFRLTETRTQILGGDILFTGLVLPLDPNARYGELSSNYRSA